MKNKFLHFLCFSLVILGLGGLLWVNSHKSARSSDVSSFDPLLKSDQRVFKSGQESDSDRVAAIIRLCVNKNREVRGWILENLGHESKMVKKSMIEGLGHFPDPVVNELLINTLKGSDKTLSRAALKALGTVQNEKRAKILSELETSKWKVPKLVQFHFSHFKAKSYFNQKKKDLVWLIELAKTHKDGPLLREIVTGLAKIVPNFERYHELLKELLYKSNDEFIINQSIIHLSVYEKRWLSQQSVKIMESKNKMITKAFLLRSGAFCPKDLNKVVSFYNKNFDDIDFSSELENCL